MSGSAVTGLYNHPLGTACRIHTWCMHSAILGIIDITTLLLPAVTIPNKNQKQKQEQKTKELSKQTHGNNRCKRFWRTDLLESTNRHKAYRCEVCVKIWSINDQKW